MITPKLDDNDVPWCNDECPSYDGKRCRLLGLRPSTICEPAVVEINERVAKLEAALSSPSIRRVEGLREAVDLISATMGNCLVCGDAAEPCGQCSAAARFAGLLRGLAEKRYAELKGDG